MKLAVATDDGVSVSTHFGRSRYFLVLDMDGTAIKSREQRTNTHTAHAQGNCHGGGRHDHGHSHAAIVEALKDCSAVLCAGMGWRAASDLTAHGIQPFVVESGSSAEQAVSAYLAGKAAPGPFCSKTTGHQQTADAQV